MDVDDEMDEDDNLMFPFSVDNEDYSGITLDDAVNDKIHLPKIAWPNDIYREIMEIIIKY